MSLRCLHVQGDRGECDLVPRSHTGSEVHKMGIGGFQRNLAYLRSGSSENRLPPSNVPVPPDNGPDPNNPIASAA